MKEWITLLKRKTITMGPPARCARHDITLLGYTKSNVTAFGKCPNHHIWPRFSSDWCQDTSDSWCLRRKCATQLMRWHYKILRKWTMESSSESWVHHYTKEMMRGWMMDSATIPRVLLKDGFPQLCEQGDSICQIKWYNWVCSRNAYTIKHWLKGAPEIWA